jgi:hypothetical protein
VDDSLAALIRESVRSIIGDGSGDLVTALLDAGWRELSESSPQQCTAILFEEHARAVGRSRLLDLIVLTALGLDGAPAAPPHVAYPDPAGGAELSSTLADDGTSVQVDGLLLASPVTPGRLLVPVRGSHGPACVLVDAAALRLDRIDGMCPEWGLLRVRGQVPVDGDMASVAVTSADWAQAVADARRALAHDLQSTAETMLEIALAHARDRVQFGRPIGSFQALKGLAADAFVLLQASRLAVEEADADPSDRRKAAVSKSMTGAAARQTAAVTQQILGAIGFTHEHVFRRHAERVQVLDVLLGSGHSIRRDIAASLRGNLEVPRLGGLL